MLRKNLIISAVVVLFAIEGYFIYQEHIKPENIAIKQINDIQKSITSLTDKCRSSIWTTLPDIKDRHILDSLYGRATQKENECLKKELLSLIFTKPASTKASIAKSKTIQTHTTAALLPNIFPPRRNGIASF